MWQRINRSVEITKFSDGIFPKIPMFCLRKTGNFKALLPVNWLTWEKKFSISQIQGSIWDKILKCSFLDRFPSWKLLHFLFQQIILFNFGQDSVFDLKNYFFIVPRILFFLLNDILARNQKVLFFSAYPLKYRL
jgi:hypothetical protein